MWEVRISSGSTAFEASLIVVSTLPIMCIYPFLQRFFERVLCWCAERAKREL